MTLVQALTTPQPSAAQEDTTNLISVEGGLESDVPTTRMLGLKRVMPYATAAIFTVHRSLRDAQAALPSQDQDDETVRKQLAEDNIPDTFRVETKWPELAALWKVQNQGQCGSCWAVSGADTLTFHQMRAAWYSPSTDSMRPDPVSVMNKQVMTEYPFERASAMSILRCGGENHIDGGARATFATGGKANLGMLGRDFMNGCNGGVPDSFWAYCVANSGLPSEEQDESEFGYNVQKANSCTNQPSSSSCSSKQYCGEGGKRVMVPLAASCKPLDPQNASVGSLNTMCYELVGEVAIKKHVLKYGPVQTAISVYKSLMNPNGVGGPSAVYRSGKGESIVGGHAVVIVGWGQQNGNRYWIIKNSWGATWNGDGHVKIDVHDKTMTMTNYVLHNTNPEQSRPATSTPTGYASVGFCACVIGPPQASDQKAFQIATSLNPALRCGTQDVFKLVQTYLATLNSAPIMLDRVQAGRQLQCANGGTVDLAESGIALSTCTAGQASDPLTGLVFQGSPTATTSGTTCSNITTAVPLSQVTLMNARPPAQGVRWHQDATQPASTKNYGINVPVGIPYSVFPVSQPDDTACIMPEQYNIPRFQQTLRQGGFCRACVDGKPMSSAASPHMQRELAAYEAQRYSIWGCPNRGYATFPGSALVPAPEQSKACLR